MHRNKSLTEWSRDKSETLCNIS